MTTTNLPITNCWQVRPYGDRDQGQILVMAPSHYLNNFLAHERNFRVSVYASILYNEIENYTLEITSNFPRDQSVKGDWELFLLISFNYLTNWITNKTIFVNPKSIFDITRDNNQIISMG